MVDPLSYFSFQPVIHDWCNKGRGICYPVCGMMHIKEPLLLIGKSSPCGGSGFPLPLSGPLPYICMTPYNRKENVLSASLNKKVPSFFFLWRCGAVIGHNGLGGTRFTIWYRLQPSASCLPFITTNPLT